VAEKVADIASQRAKDARRHRRDIIQQGRREQMDKTNHNVDIGRRRMLLLLVKGECLLIFALGALGIFRTEVLDVSQCSEPSNSYWYVILGENAFWVAWVVTSSSTVVCCICRNILSGSFFAQVEFIVCSTWGSFYHIQIVSRVKLGRLPMVGCTGVLKIVFWLAAAIAWTALTNWLNIFPPRIQAWNSLLSFAMVASVPIQSHLSQVRKTLPCELIDNSVGFIIFPTLSHSCVVLRR